MTKCMYCGEDAKENHVCVKCEQESEKLEEGSSFKKWYAENKDKVSERRKTKYGEDEEYRNQKKLAAKRYYWLKQRRAKSIGLNKADYEELELIPDTMLSVTIQNELDLRYLCTYEVPVFYPRKVAEVVRRSTQTLRLWFLRGYLADVMHRSGQKYRVFTEDQMRLFVENRHWLSFEVQDFSVHPFFVLVNEGLEALQPDGIEPMYRDSWRFDPAPCPFCYRNPSLQHLVEGRWVTVSCFSCMSPLDVQGRQEQKRFLVAGTCKNCGEALYDELDAVDEHAVRVTCQRCGRQVDKVTVTELK